MPLFDDVLRPPGRPIRRSPPGFRPSSICWDCPGPILARDGGAHPAHGTEGPHGLLFGFHMSLLGRRVVLDIRNRLRPCSASVPRFLHRNSTGQLMSRMNSDVEQVQEAVSTTLGELFREDVLLLALVVWTLFIDWKLAGLALLIAPAALGLTLSMGKRIRRVSLAAGRASRRSAICCSRRSAEYGREGLRHGKPRNGAPRGGCGATLPGQHPRDAHPLFELAPHGDAGGPGLHPAALLCARAHRGRDPHAGIFGGSLFSLFRMYDPIRKLSRIHIQFQRAFASSSRILELSEMHVEMQDRPGAGELRAVHRSIEFAESTSATAMIPAGSPSWRNTSMSQRGRWWPWWARAAPASRPW